MMRDRRVLVRGHVDDFNVQAASGEWSEPLSRVAYPYRGRPHVEQLPVERIVDLEE